MKARRYEWSWRVTVPGLPDAGEPFLGLQNGGNFVLVQSRVLFAELAYGRSCQAFTLSEETRAEGEQTAYVDPTRRMNQTPSGHHRGW